MPVKKVLLLLLFYTYNFTVCHSQKIIENIKYQTEIGAFLSTSGQNPFWLRSNPYGIVPLESQFITLRGSAYKEFDSTKTDNNKISKFGYGYGASTAINVGKVNQIYLPEAYFKVRYGAFEFYAGRKKEIVGLVDTTLTSGSFIWSGNALPIPKVQISIPNYTSIIGKGLISIKGSYAHGWFGSDRPYTSHLKLHQKSFYGRIGRESWLMRFYGGFNHQVQWGGYSPFYTVDGKLPDGFKNYLHAVLGTRGAIESIETSNFDANRVGNHLGTIDIGTDIQFHDFTLFVYRQNIYDDGSLYYLNNISDGLNGLSFKFKYSKNISKLTFEYLNTSNQGGAVFALGENAPNELRGGDSYFQNAQIRDGWTYKNKIIGTPFLQTSILNYQQKSNNFFIDNTRIKALSFSVLGEIKNINYKLFYSFSKNYGTYTDTINPSFLQSSFNLTIEKKDFLKKNIKLLCNYSFDYGELYSNVHGFSILLRKNW